MWGHHAVCETLRSGIWPVLEIFASREAFELSNALLQTQIDTGVPVEVVADNRLERLSGSSEHQGLVVRMGAFPYQSIEQFERTLRSSIAQYSLASTTASDARLPMPLVVICDRIQDAFNFGAILRCCDGARVAGVIVGESYQAEVTPHVARASSGAVNYVPIIRTNNLIATANIVKELGAQLVAADSNSTTGIWGAALDRLTALVIGSEAHGLQPELLAISDQRVSIPMQGHVTSLNAAVATGILLYEIRRQQSADRKT